MLTFGRKIKLAPDQVEIAQYIMASSVAHYGCATIHYSEKAVYERNLPSEDSVAYFTLVSFELNLFSIELSLKFLLFLCSNGTVSPTSSRPHDLEYLYNEIKKQKNGKATCRKILKRTNQTLKKVKYEQVNKTALEKCLSAQATKYLDIRYFWVDKKWKSLLKTDFSSMQEWQIIRCLGYALIDLNAEILDINEIEYLSMAEEISASFTTPITPA